MAASPAYAVALPGIPDLDGFVNGELALSATDILNVGAYATFWFARRMYLPPGNYVVTLFAVDAATLRVGSDAKSSRVVASARAGDGPVTVAFHVMPGETRLDLVVSNLQDALAASYAVFNITRDGKLVYTSAAQDWQFDVAAIPDADLLGIDDPLAGVPVFTVLPNWKHGVTERLSWLTDILSGQTGSEQRRSVRVGPRRSFEATFSRASALRARLDNFVMGIGRKPFLVPLWHEQVRIPVAFGFDDPVELPAGVTAAHEFLVGTRVLVNNGDPALYEVATVATLSEEGEIEWVEPLDHTWPPGTRLIPLRMARIAESSQMALLTDRVGEMTIQFELVEPDGHEAAWGAQGPLFAFTPNWTTRPVLTYDRLAFALDNGSGVVEFTDPGQQTRVGQRFDVLLRGRAEVSRFRRFIAKARGRAVRFDMPSFAQDIVAAGDLGGEYIEAVAGGFAELNEVEQAARKGVSILLRDGEIIRRDITDVLPVDVGGFITRERYYLSEPLPDIPLVDVMRIQWTYPARFDQDTFELHHHVDSSAAVTTALVTRSVDPTEDPPEEPGEPGEPEGVVFFDDTFDGPESFVGGHKPNIGFDDSMVWADFLSGSTMAMDDGRCYGVHPFSGQITGSVNYGLQSGETGTATWDTPQSFRAEIDFQRSAAADSTDGILSGDGAMLSFNMANSAPSDGHVLFLTIAPFADGTVQFGIFTVVPSPYEFRSVTSEPVAAAMDTETRVTVVYDLAGGQITAHLGTAAVSISTADLPTGLRVYGVEMNTYNKHGTTGNPAFQINRVRLVDPEGGT